MKHTATVCNIPFTTATMTQCVDFLCRRMDTRTRTVVHTANARALVLAKDRDLCALFSKAELTVPDGDGVLLAARLQYKKAIFPQKIAGIDLLWQLLLRCETEGYRVFLFGGKEGVAKRAAQKLRAALPRLTVCGTWQGYLQAGENEKLLRAIRAAAPHLLVVCLGMPRQEQWMQANKNRLPPMVMGGFGGSLDVFAGDLRRSPLWIRKAHGEWLYRVFCQPKRLLQMRGYPKLYASLFFSKAEQSEEN